MGVTIEDNLTWDSHINKLIRKIHSKLLTLKRIRHYLPLDVWKIVYAAYILPYMDYCMSIWSGTSNANINKILIIQKLAGRHILRRNVRTPSGQMFLELGWEDASTRAKYRMIILIYKIFNKLTPPYLHKLIFFSVSRTYSLRSESQQLLTLPPIHCNYFVVPSNIAALRSGMICHCVSETHHF